jgi:hypothetical protein
MTLLIWICSSNIGIPLKTAGRANFFFVVSSDHSFFISSPTQNAIQSLYHHPPELLHPPSNPTLCTPLKLPFHIRRYSNFNHYRTHATLPHYYPLVPLISSSNSARPFQTHISIQTSTQHISPGNQPRPLILPLKPAAGAQFLTEPVNGAENSARRYGIIMH